MIKEIIKNTVHKSKTYVYVCDGCGAKTSNGSKFHTCIICGPKKCYCKKCLHTIDDGVDFSKDADNVITWYNLNELCDMFYMYCSEHNNEKFTLKSELHDMVKEINCLADELIKKYNDIDKRFQKLRKKHGKNVKW